MFPNRLVYLKHLQHLYILLNYLNNYEMVHRNNMEQLMLLYCLEYIHLLIHRKNRMHKYLYLLHYLVLLQFLIHCNIQMQHSLYLLHYLGLLHLLIHWVEPVTNITLSLKLILFLLYNIYKTLLFTSTPIISYFL